MGLQPKGPRGGDCIDTSYVPPSGFVTTAMDFTVVSAAEWDSELVADLATERW
jgi:hypothetical protein